MTAYYSTHATNVGMLVLAAVALVTVLWRSRSYQTPRERAGARAGLVTLGRVVERVRAEQDATP